MLSSNTLITRAPDLIGQIITGLPSCFQVASSYKLLLTFICSRLWSLLIVVIYGMIGARLGRFCFNLHSRWHTGVKRERCRGSRGWHSDSPAVPAPIEPFSLFPLQPLAIICYRVLTLRLRAAVNRLQVQPVNSGNIVVVSLEKTVSVCSQQSRGIHQELPRKGGCSAIEYSHSCDVAPMILTCQVSKLDSCKCQLLQSDRGLTFP